MRELNKDTVPVYSNRNTTHQHTHRIKNRPKRLIVLLDMVLNTSGTVSVSPLINTVLLSAQHTSWVSWHPHDNIYLHRLTADEQASVQLQLQTLDTFSQSESNTKKQKTLCVCEHLKAYETTKTLVSHR